MPRWRLAVVIVSLGCSRTHAAELTPQPAPVTDPRPPSAQVATSVAEVATSVAHEQTTPPAVDVRSIGMHIGGGPNDDANKAPLLASIASHQDALGRCWAALPTRSKIEFGIDADVPANGGRARISRPRSTMNDAAFIACAVGVFEGIEFLPPKSGIKTTVSTSVRFSPRK